MPGRCRRDSLVSDAAERCEDRTQLLVAQMAEARKLDAAIEDNLKELGYGG